MSQLNWKVIPKSELQDTKNCAAHEQRIRYMGKRQKKISSMYLYEIYNEKQEMREYCGVLL